MRIITYSQICLLFLAVVLVMASCRKISPIDQDQTPYELEIGDFPAPAIATDNPLTKAGVELGRRLFYETKLSLDGSQSCASCHRQEHAFSDTARFSIGVEGLPGGRQAMAVINMAWNTNEFFWDGRAHLLRDQSLKPIQDPLEMNETLDGVIAKLGEDPEYRDQFTQAFGDEEITSERMSLAMEQFMNSITSVESKYDKYLRGDLSLSPEEERGRILFETEHNPFFPDLSGADCAHCHSGRNFENDLYMNNGLDTDATMADSGRAKVSKDPNDLGKFKVPTLRNIEVTPPYMHDGRFATLEEVVDHYNSGVKNSSTLDHAIEHTTPTGLLLDAQEKADLIAFLKTLTDDVALTKEEYSSPFK